MAALTKLVGRFTETDIDDEIIVMRLDNGEFLTLAGTAAVTWRLIDGKRDRGELIDALEAEFDTGDHDIASDVGQFLLHLQGAGLIAEH